MCSAIAMQLNCSGANREGDAALPVHIDQAAVNLDAGLTFEGSVGGHDLPIRGAMLVCPSGHSYDSCDI